MYTSANEEDANMHFAHGFCNSNCFCDGLLSTIFTSQEPHCVQKTLWETGFFSRATAKPEQRADDDHHVAAVQRSPSTSICKIFTTTGVAQIVMVSPRIICVEYETPFRDITSTVYDFVKDCNHGYTLCATFCSRMRFYLPDVAIPLFVWDGITNKRNSTPGHMKIQRR
jgi:hypothetical protein